MSPPRLPRVQHYANSSCDDPAIECSPLPGPPVVPIPLPPPPSSPNSHGRATFVTSLIIAGPVVAALIICLSVFLFVRHRRRRRRRQEEALTAATVASEFAAAATLDFGGGPDLEDGGGGVVHHAWHIRTVGLDEAAIESIALTRYRAGGVIGASDCAVCLGEFSDGELLRLLPKCAHAFHVACIDTWLRAHVNCPLCRARVLDPDAAAAVEQGDPPAGTDAASSTRTTEPLDQQASEQPELRLQIDRHDGQSSSPEQPHHHPSPRGRNFRRVASMDSPSPIASAEEAAPEDDLQAGDEKQGTGTSAVHREFLPPDCSDHRKNHRGMKRSLSICSRWALVSRHCRRSSSLLPL